MSLPNTTEISPKRKKTNPVKKTLTVIGTTVLSLVLIVIITGAIVATALTVYVMKFMDNTTDIDLYNVEMGSTSFLYGYDKQGSEVEIHRLSRDENRIIVSLDDVPKFVQEAFVYREDERFYDHEGVDFKRTFAAFVNMIVHIYDTEQGGSTITQQLVKNITGDDDVSPARKVREIFSAMNLEREYTKDQILEAYLNYIGFGSNIYGVEAASNRYFGKSVSEISIAQAASLAAIPKAPNELNPFADPKKNKEYQEIVLGLMLKNSAISDEEYEIAMAEDLQIVDKNAPNNGEAATNTSSKVQSYFVDMVINDVAEDMMELYGYSDIESTIEKLSNGGYKIYTTVDLEMQKAVEQKYLDSKTFSGEVLKDPPQSAFICMDYQGNIKAVVGGIGEKPSPMCWNRATMSKRSIGSCIKPISTYGLGLTLDVYHWSTIFNDKPIEIKNYKTGGFDKWPKNYSNRWSYNNYYTYQALQRSLNTVPAQLAEQLTPKAIYDFMQKKMGITSLVEADIDYSPMTVGGLTNGITLEELVSSYQAFGNAGKIYQPTSYTKVLDLDGKVILEHKYVASQALDEDTAYVMNKLMKTVIEGPNGTGVAARLKNTPLIGKTGTSQDWIDLSFVGCTPDYVSGVWYGYDEQYIEKKDKDGKTVLDENGKAVIIPHVSQNLYYSSAKVWKNIFGDIADAGIKKEFPANTNVEELKFCTITGLIAGVSCPASADVGYYKPSNIPATCNGLHNSGNMIVPPAATTVPGATTPPSAPVITTPPPASVPTAIPGVIPVE